MVPIRAMLGRYILRSLLNRMIRGWYVHEMTGGVPWFAVGSDWPEGPYANRKCTVSRILPTYIRGHIGRLLDYLRASKVKSWINPSNQCQFWTLMDPA